MPSRNALQLYEQTARAFESIGTPMIGRDTAARVCAIILNWGNNEAMVMSHKLTIEVQHIQRMYHIDGAMIPDPDFAALLRYYCKATAEHIPDWAHTLFQDRYGIKLYE